MKRVALVFAVCCTVALRAQQVRPAPPTTGTAAVRGRVLAAATREPVRNARVELEADGRPVSVVLADAEGRFALLSLPAGRYTLTAAKPGFIKTALGSGREPRATERLQVRAGATVDGLEIQLLKAGAIAGRILDDAGDPVIDAEVTATRVGDGGRTTATGETDDLGQYRLGGLPDGRFTVAVTLSPLLTRMRDAVAGAAALPLGPEGALVHLVDGVMRAGVTPRTTHLYYPGAEDFLAAQPIELVAGEERTTIDFNLPAAAPSAVVDRKAILDTSGRRIDSAATAEIQGRILQADGRSLTRAQVRLERVDGSGVGTGTVTDADGRYQFGGLRPAEYLLVANKRGYLDAEYGQSRAFEKGQAIALKAGDKRDRTDLVLPRAGSIAGRVLDENGDAVEGARVQVLQSRFEGGRAHLIEVETASRRTDDLGAYRVHGLQPGTYVVRAVIGQAEGAHDGSTGSMAAIPGYAPTYYPGTTKAAEARWVTVGVSEDLREVELAMGRVRTARVSGHAYTSSGETVKGGLMLTPSRRSGAVDATPLRPARLWGPDGSFEFRNVPPGEYVLQAGMGRAHMWSEGEFAARYIMVDGADLDDLVIRTSTGSTITGRITFEGGDAPRPAEIGLSPLPVDPDLSPAFGVGPMALGPPARAEVHADWTFEIEGISGPRRLRLTYPPAGWMLKSIDLNGVDITDAVLMFGTTDQSLRDVHVVLTNQVTAVEGRVTDVWGRLAHDCLVVAFTTDAERRAYPSRYMDHSVCQRDGTFILRRLPPDDYFVAALELRSNQGPEDWRDPRLLDAIAPRSTKVTLADGQHVSMALRLLVP